jgi:hypothetical protein
LSKAIKDMPSVVLFQINQIVTCLFDMLDEPLGQVAYDLLVMLSGSHFRRSSPRMA